MCAKQATPSPRVRFRIDFSEQCSVGAGKIELLEGIARTGSLSQAAREMRMSYRRAWLLLDDLNHSFDSPVAHTSTGGTGGGGAVLTAFGELLVAGYRKFESSLQPLAHRHLGEASRHTAIAGKGPKQTLHASPISARLKQHDRDPAKG
jgi:molybdate transport system regulatory protein